MPAVTPCGAGAPSRSSRRGRAPGESKSSMRKGRGVGRRSDSAQVRSGLEQAGELRPGLPAGRARRGSASPLRKAAPLGPVRAQGLEDRRSRLGGRLNVVVEAWLPQAAGADGKADHPAALLVRGKVRITRIAASGTKQPAFRIADVEASGVGHGQAVERDGAREPAAAVSPPVRGSSRGWRLARRPSFVQLPGTMDRAGGSGAPAPARFDRPGGGAA